MPHLAHRPARSFPFESRFFAGLLLASLLLAGCRTEERAAERNAGGKARHLLLITVDTLRADHVGVYGRSPSPTPSLDALARDGALFRQVQSQVPLTLPSHATIFTGKLPFETGVRNNGTYALPESAATLAEQLASARFTTGAAVASFVLARKFGLAQGFASYDDDLGSDNALRALRAEIPASRVYEKWQRWLGGYAPRAKAETGSRFFYWAHFYDPHLPYEPPAEDLARFPGDPYSGEVAFADRQIGRMIADLEREGLLADTLVVVTADHGEAFGEHGEHGHGLLAYQESLAVPLVLRGPGIPAGKTVASRVGLVDLMPSLLEALGVGVPSGLSGRSILPLLAAERTAGEPSGEPTFYFETLLGKEDRNWAPITGLIRGDDKLIAVPRAELYDLAADPGEKNNHLDSERRRWRELDEQLRALLLGKNEDGAARVADEQDLATLRSLGYVSSGGAGGTVLDPKDGIALEARLREVEQALAAGRTEPASQALDAARKAWPGVEQPAFYLLEMQIRGAKGDRAGATAALRRGVARLPEVFPLHFELLRHLFEQRLYREAIEEGGKLLARQPSSSQVLILLAKSRVETGDLPGALADFEKAKAADPGNTEIEAEIAGVLMRSGRGAEALAIHNRLVDAGAYEGKGRRLLEAAMLNAQAGDRARALTLFDRGLQLEPNGFFMLTSALLLAQDGRRAEAVERMRQALENHGGDLNPQQKDLARQALRSWGG